MEGRVSFSVLLIDVDNQIRQGGRQDQDLLHNHWIGALNGEMQDRSSVKGDLDVSSKACLIAALSPFLSTSNTLNILTDASIVEPTGSGSIFSCNSVLFKAGGSDVPESFGMLSEAFL